MWRGTHTFDEIQKAHTFANLQKDKHSCLYTEGNTHLQIYRWHTEMLMNRGTHTKFLVYKRTHTFVDIQKNTHSC